MKKALKITIWVIVAAIFIGTFVFLYKNSQPDEIRYEITSPQSDITIARTTVLTGKIEPRDEITVKPQISGIISEISVEPGDIVNQGDIIAKIKVIPDASQLSSALSRVELAKIALNDAQLKYDRQKLLLEKKVASREEFENAEATLLKAKSELSGAQDAYAIVKEGISKTNASESNTNVRATTTGIVLDVPVKVGSSVIQANTFNDGTTIATIADMNNLIFKGNVDETDVAALKVGMPMSIKIGAMPDLSPSARIEYISPKGTASNGANTFEIRAAIETDGTAMLRSGYSANATVELVSQTIPLSVMESVVEFSGDSAFVYVLTDSVPKQVFKRTPVETGLSDGLNIEIKSGIEPGSRLRGRQIMDK